MLTDLIACAAAHAAAVNAGNHRFMLPHSDPSRRQYGKEESEWLLQRRECFRACSEDEKQIFRNLTGIAHP